MKKYHVTIKRIIKYSADTSNLSRDVEDIDRSKLVEVLY